MNTKTIFLDYVWISFASILTAIAVNMFFIHTGLAPGGITGLAIIFSTILKIPISYMTLAISGPLLILSTILLGKGFGIKTLYISIATPICIYFVPSFDIINLLMQTNEILALTLAGSAGGLLVGSAIGIALNRGCATGGTDVIALLIQYFAKRLKISNVLLILDGSIVIASGIISQNILISIFSFLSLVVIINTIKAFSEKQWVATRS